MFQDIAYPEALLDAWEKFRRGKRRRPDVLRFERNLENNLFELHDLLVHGNYRHGAYQPFTICDPKQRLIHKATVQDRLVHQAVVSAIEPVFERQFIFDSYSCRKSKGTHAAVKRLQTFLRRASANNQHTVYALKCDIKQFFASVDQRILRDLIGRRINDPKVLAVVDEIIGSHGSGGRGMPLGNLTSQLFANIYLHELDWFVKQGLRQKYYLRYCDDFIVVSYSRKQLEQLVPMVAGFLEANLRLQLHPNKTSSRSWYQGVDFLGYVLKPSCVGIRTKTKQRMLARVSSANLASYQGLCSHANAYELERLLATIAGNTGT